MNIFPLLLCDGYKFSHKVAYPVDTTLVYSNLTPRKGRDTQSDGMVFFGLQYFLLEYLQRQFNEHFFGQDTNDIQRLYARRLRHYLGGEHVTDHLAALHALGYLPLEIRAVPEGTLVPYGVPVLTVHNTHPDFFWLPNFLETILSNVLWLPCTSATTALQYRRTFERFASLTGGLSAFVPWQGHDFSMRGLAGVEAAMLSGAAHLLSFTGTDSVPALDFLEHYYSANVETELVGGSVPATEHSVMSLGGMDDEFTTFKRLITEVYPTGIVSIVSDTWDLWRVLTDYLPRLKAEILARDGKVVIRPDSGDPELILCGTAPYGNPAARTPSQAGVVNLLWEHFGGTVNAAGYRELDPHVGTIYGDSITPIRQQAILQNLADQHFASTNVVLGIGSYTYQYVTRDTHGLAMKATYGETKSRGGQAIFKSPKTDDGTKYSAKGLLRVYRDLNDALRLQQECTWRESETGELRPVFIDGVLTRRDSLATIRERVAAYVYDTVPA